MGCCSQQTGIIITENAAKRIAFLTSEEEKGAKLRISVEGGGCSGFKYNFTFDSSQNKDDNIIGKGDSAIIVDGVSMEFLEGSMLDYIEDLGESYFMIKNPNASSSCGCGNSFST